MIELKQEVVELIRAELASIPEQHHNFRNVNEGLGVLREEYLELELEMFFGRKNEYDKVLKSKQYASDTPLTKEYLANEHWKDNIRKEAVQVAAMAIRIIQELT